MVDLNATGEAARDYAEAYAAHYSRRDLESAIHLYRKLMASHASSPEAGYSVVQIQNIAKSIVPARDLLDAQAELALACLQEAPSGDVAAPFTPSSAEAAP
ncbi:hypothetical protein OAE84_00830 [bacterium]|nr:hypothetical protein [bacterium]